MPLDPALFQRHHFVRADSPALDGWFAAGRPAVVRTPCHDPANDAICCGVCFPPNPGKNRTALALPRAAILECFPPPSLADCLDLVPAAWRDPLERLLDFAPRVYGSMAWQYLTGLEYLRPGSDIDLLFDAPPKLPALLARLAALPFRADGEIVLPDGAAFSWREALNSSPDILAKTRDRAFLTTKTRLGIVP